MSYNLKGWIRSQLGNNILWNGMLSFIICHMQWANGCCFPIDRIQGAGNGGLSPLPTPPPIIIAPSDPEIESVLSILAILGSSKAPNMGSTELKLPLLPDHLNPSNIISRQLEIINSDGHEEVGLLYLGQIRRSIAGIHNIHEGNSRLPSPMISVNYRQSWQPQSQLRTQILRMKVSVAPLAEVLANNKGNLQ